MTLFEALRPGPPTVALICAAMAVKLALVDISSRYSVAPDALPLDHDRTIAEPGANCGRAASTGTAGAVVSMRVWASGAEGGASTLPAASRARM